MNKHKLFIATIVCLSAFSPVASAEDEVSSEKTITSYTVTIPPEIEISNETNVGVLTFSGSVNKNHRLDIKVSSADNKLKNGSHSIDYSFDKDSFELVDNFNETINLKASGTSLISGEYRDQLTFNFSCVALKVDILLKNGEEVIETLKLSEGETISLPSPAKEGKVFVGWFSDPTDGVKIEDGTKYDGSYTTLYTRYEDVPTEPTETVNLATGQKLTIAGNEYTVIEQVEGSKYKVLATDTFEGAFDSRGNNNYTNATIATYLDNDYYNSLVESIKDAIVETSIQQKVSTADFSGGKNNPTWESEKDAGTHKVFIPSWDEVTKVYGSDFESLKAYSNGKNVWLRDIYDSNEGKPFVLYVHHTGGLLSILPHYNDGYFRPAFVLDLSKVEYTTK